jgi:hypothetical protein
VKVRSGRAIYAWPVLLLAMASFGTSKQSATVVDSGSFGIYVNGQRVATERFSIQQTATGSIVDSQLEEEGLNQKAAQNSKMQLTSQGELLRYEWHELIPEKLDLELLPNDQFLIERVTMKPGEKPQEHPFLLPSSTVVLDNNFFVHRELLAWRYLAQSCKQEAGKFQCVSGPTTFGVVVPQGRSSTRVTVEPVGHEKIQVSGKERDLARFNLKVEDDSWSLWLDDQDHFKVVKIAIGNEKTEVVRD